jgi:hypothetical protein
MEDLLALVQDRIDSSSLDFLKDISTIVERVTSEATACMEK